ncbi:MAG TPA: alcohol dehydrogenase catalytic domain-containing protein [Dehalococcoidia bacterium]|nr:alcohol dehydrogenase catalytic domain-containing protein [Dehalococcoidia bacterium]
MAEARAMVMTGPGAMEPRVLPLPEVGPDEALLEVEACGICGTDYEQFRGEVYAPYPFVPGHEPVGRIAAIGERAAARWGLRVGERVAVEPAIPCLACGLCLSGRYTLCMGRGGMRAYGFMGLSVPPGLWGGYASHLYLAPGSLLHRVPEGVPAELAVLFNPLGAGFRWAVELGELRVGETIAILGPGQRGLACVIAAREAGAGCIIVAGLGADEGRLALARELGAHHTINVEAEEVVAAVRRLTDGRGADVVVDVTPYAAQAVAQAIEMAAPGGRVVLAGTKGRRPVPQLYSDRIVARELTVRGALGVDYGSYERALATIASGRYPLQRLHSHTLPLEEAALALRLLAREVPGEEALHIALVP